MKIKLLFLLAFLFLCPNLSRAVTCLAVSNGGAGSKTGADWNNSLDGNAILNNGTLVRGDVYYFAKGTYTSTTNINQADSGSTLITFKVATAADQGQTCSPSIGAGWNTSTMGVDGFSNQVVLPASFLYSVDHILIDGTVSATASATEMGCQTTSGCGFKINNPCTNSTCSTTAANR